MVSILPALPKVNRRRFSRPEAFDGVTGSASVGERTDGYQDLRSRFLACRLKAIRRLFPCSSKYGRTHSSNIFGSHGPLLNARRSREVAADRIELLRGPLDRPMGADVWIAHVRKAVAWCETCETTPSRFNTLEAIFRREGYRASDETKAILTALWSWATGHGSHAHPRLEFGQYAELIVRISLSCRMVPSLEVGRTDAEVQESIRILWAADSWGSKFIFFGTFVDSIFDIVDVVSRDIKEASYVAVLRKIKADVTAEPLPPPRLWRNVPIVLEAVEAEAEAQAEANEQSPVVLVDCTVDTVERIMFSDAGRTRSSPLIGSVIMPTAVAGGTLRSESTAESRQEGCGVGLGASLDLGSTLPRGSSHGSSQDSLSARAALVSLSGSRVASARDLQLPSLLLDASEWLANQNQPAGEHLDCIAPVGDHLGSTMLMYLPSTAETVRSLSVLGTNPYEGAFAATSHSFDSLDVTTMLSVRSQALKSALTSVAVDVELVRRYFVPTGCPRVKLAFSETRSRPHGLQMTLQWRVDARGRWGVATSNVSEDAAADSATILLARPADILDELPEGTRKDTVPVDVYDRWEYLIPGGAALARLEFSATDAEPHGRFVRVSWMKDAEHAVPLISFAASIPAWKDVPTSVPYSRGRQDEPSGSMRVGRLHATNPILSTTGLASLSETIERRMRRGNYACVRTSTVVSVGMHEVAAAAPASCQVDPVTQSMEPTDNTGCGPRCQSMFEFRRVDVPALGESVQTRDLTLCSRLRRYRAAHHGVKVHRALPRSPPSDFGGRLTLPLIKEGEVRSGASHQTTPQPLSSILKYKCRRAEYLQSALWNTSIGRTTNATTALLSNAEIEREHQKFQREVSKLVLPSVAAAMRSAQPEAQGWQRPTLW